MHHDILGKIKRSKKSGVGIATIEYDSRKIEVQIIPDDQPFETTLNLAAEVIEQLKGLDKQAKHIIVTELRDNYNSGWNEYDEAQEDGSFKRVSNPQLSERQFEKKFTLNAINVTGDKMVDLFYNDSGLFWGHSVFVNSLNGTDFSEARAHM